MFLNQFVYAIVRKRALLSLFFQKYVTLCTFHHFIIYTILSAMSQNAQLTQKTSEQIHFTRWQFDAAFLLQELKNLHCQHPFSFRLIIGMHENIGNTTVPEEAVAEIHDYFPSVAHPLRE